MTDTERADRAEAAVGTLQTALRQHVAEWRGDYGPDDHSLFRTVREQCADQLQALLPALEPTP